VTKKHEAKSIERQVTRNRDVKWEAAWEGGRIPISSKICYSGMKRSWSSCTHRSSTCAEKIARGRYCYVGVNLRRAMAVTAGAAKGGNEGGGNNSGGKQPVCAIPATSAGAQTKRCVDEKTPPHQRS
jgi:hypothetical protein